MANRYYNQMFYTLHKFPVQIDSDVFIGAAGAVTGFAGIGLTNVVHDGTGLYRFVFDDNYANFYDVSWTMESAPTGGPVTGGAFVVGTLYRILTLGTTTQAQWVAAGVPASVTAAPGVIFTATTVGAGTGTVNSYVNSGIFALEVAGGAGVVGAPNIAGIQSIGPVPNFVNNPAGAMVTLRLLNGAGALTDPVNGSIIGTTFYLGNSTSAVKGIL